MTQAAVTTGAAVASVFGLDVHSPRPLLLLQGAPGARTGRTLELALAASDGDPHGWPQSAELVCDQRERDGAISFRIEADPHAGYLIWGPAYGRHVLSADGTRALCAPQGRTEAEWQRLLVAQVLPFAALLRGLEVLHASAVVHAGRALALLGPSRSGKTSLALALCRRGASFLADDVLALECTGEELLGYPGTPVAGVAHDEAQRLDHNAMPAIARNDRERLVRMCGATQPAPLAAMFLLERRADGPGTPRFEPLLDGTPLLAATFNTVLTAPARLHGLLEICALAARHRVERVRFGPALDASQLAEAVLERLGRRA